MAGGNLVIATDRSSIFHKKEHKFALTTTTVNDLVSKLPLALNEGIQDASSENILLL
jgi:hypothetical protein